MVSPPRHRREAVSEMKVTARVLVVVALCAAVPPGALAAHVTLTAPGRLHTQRLAVVAPAVCWTGSVTFTPSSPDNGNPAYYHKIVVAGAAGAFSACIGQYADVSINKGTTQIDFAKSYKLSNNDTAGFTANLSRGVLPVPVPTGTKYTLVIHP